MIENDTVSQGTIDGLKASTEPAQNKALRASNTVKTLEPKEVSPAFSLQAGEYSFERAEGTSAANLVRNPDPPVYPAPEERRELKTATISEGVANALGATIDDKGTLHTKPESLPDVPKKVPETIFRPQSLPGVPGKLAEPAKVSKPSYVPKPAPVDLAARVTKLEGQVDGLLDRIARYNQKSSHKL